MNLALGSDGQLAVSPDGFTYLVAPLFSKDLKSTAGLKKDSTLKPLTAITGEAIAWALREAGITEPELNGLRRRQFMESGGNEPVSMIDIATRMALLDLQTQLKHKFGEKAGKPVDIETPRTDLEEFFKLLTQEGVYVSPHTFVREVNSHLAHPGNPRIRYSPDEPVKDKVIRKAKQGIGTAVAVSVVGTAAACGSPSSPAVIQQPTPIARATEGPKIMPLPTEVGPQFRAATTQEQINQLSSDPNIVKIFLFGIPVLAGNVSLAAQCANGGCTVIRNPANPQEIIGIAVAAKALTDLGIKVGAAGAETAVWAGVVNLGLSGVDLGEGRPVWDTKTQRWTRIGGPQAQVKASVETIKGIQEGVITTIDVGKKALVRINAAAGDSTFKNPDPNQKPGQVRPTVQAPDKAPQKDDKDNPKSEYKYENGDPILKAPEGPLKDLFRPTSEAVYRRLQENGVVIATAPSGVGKTELFAGQKPYEAGGLKTILREKGLSSGFFDAQSLQSEAAGRIILEAYKNAGRPDVFIIDEALSLGSPQFKDGLQAIAQLRSQGVKFVFIGGGYNSTQTQFKTIQDVLNQVGISVPAKDLIPIPPYEMTPNQVAELLVTQGVSREQGLAIAVRLQKARIPLTYRIVIGSSNTDIQDTDQDLLESKFNQMWGIKRTGNP